MLQFAFERFLAIFFFLSLVTIFLLLGVSVTLFKLSSTIVLVIVGGLLCIAMLTLFFRKFFVTITCALLLSVFINGLLLEKKQVDFLSVWMEQSIIDLDEMLFPIVRYSGDDAYYPTWAHAQLVYEIHVSKNNFQTELGKKMSYIVSTHRHGILLLRHGAVTLLKRKRVNFHSFDPATNALYYIEAGNTMFTKAILEGDRLRRVWSTKVQGHYLHHWGDTFEGVLYQPGNVHAYLPSGLQDDALKTYQGCQKQLYSQAIHRYDVDTGEHLGAIRLRDHFARAQDLYASLPQGVRSCGRDFHFNNIQIVKTPQHASYFPDGKVGDILVSLRDTHLIALLDRDSYDVKWFLKGSGGKYVKQHSPRISDRGTLLIFDNFGSSKENGTSRIVEVDIATKELLGYYEAGPGEHFGSSQRGMIALQDGEIYVQDQSTPRGVSLFRLDCPTEYVSMECVRKNVFTADKGFLYDNIGILP